MRLLRAGGGNRATTAHGDARGRLTDGGTPHVLLAFAIYTAVAVLVASIVAVFVVRHNVEENSKEKVADHTRFAAAAVIPAYLARDEWSRALRGRRLREFDAMVRANLLTDGTLRAKLYNSDGVTIYATDPTLIGKRADNSAELRSVLSGRVLTAVERLNHEGGSGPDAKVFESYAPVRYALDSRATGVFELYTDYAVAAGGVKRQAVPLTIALLLVLLGLYIALLPILRRTTRALAFTNEQLRRRASELKDNLSRQAEIEERLRETIKELERSEDQLALSQEETIMRLSIAVESRDAETGSHIERMGRYCALLASKLGWSEAECELLRIASPLHDVGKIAIPDSVLQKPGALTPEERERMQEHAAIGHRILAGSDSPLLDLAARIALTHHEKWDGSGYPRGLAGEDIPLEGRIAAVADVFDALTSDRVYRPAMSLDDAFRILTEGRGSHFDPEIIDAFFSSLDEVLAIRDGVDEAPEPIRDGSPTRRRRGRVVGSSAHTHATVDGENDGRRSLVG